FVCPGAMAIVGSLESGIQGQHDILFAKAAVDVVATLVIGSVSGIGAALAAFPLLLYEAALTLAAGALSPFLTDAVVAEIACAGSILIIALGLNMLKVTRIRLGRFILAPFLVVPFYYLFSFLQ
ncbi:MAG: DUF554 family protein, partial [Clostridia bacterium]|nr:DUF554 family protein [Clostridia bacterium]